MASSQAANLTGLLSSIGSTIGEMGGPGNALIDNVRTLNAPKLDQNDPASMRAYADWAMRNGDRQTAQQYQLAAGKMEQEQGARKAATDASGFQRSLNKLEEARAQAIQNAGGDKQAEEQINAQYDTASNAVSGKMNEMASQYGLETSGTDMLEQATQRREVVAALQGELKTASADQAASIRRSIAGVKSGAMSPQEALSSLEDNADVTNSWKTAQAYARDHNESNNLKPGDDGYMTDSRAYDLTTKNDAERKQELAEASAIGAATGEQSVADLTEAYDNVTTLSEMSRDYDRAIELLSTEGAQTGAFTALLPDVKAASIELDNLRKKLGLSVVGMSNFGQLNESEMELALSTAIPKNMGEEELIDWFKRKKAATNKVIGEMNRFRAWSGQNGGGTLEEFNREEQSSDYRIDFGGDQSGDPVADTDGDSFDDVWGG
jgi:hypothetical protein